MYVSVSLLLGMNARMDQERVDFMIGYIVQLIRNKWLWLLFPPPLFFTSTPLLSFAQIVSSHQPLLYYFYKLPTMCATVMIQYKNNVIQFFSNF